MSKKDGTTKSGKIFKIFLAALAVLAIVIWATGNSYIFKTLTYLNPGIDDIDIFETSQIKAQRPEPIPHSVNYNKTKLPDALTEELEKNKSVAFVVIKEDSVVHEQYWDEFTDSTVVNSFSVAKSIVGLLAGIAIGEGLISIDDNVSKYIPAFAEGENAKLTVRHLLIMSSGLNWDESYNSLFSVTTKAYYGTGLEKIISGLKVIEEPGKIFRYMSCNTVLLSMIIEKASGKTISEYSEAKFWSPLHASYDAFWSLDDKDEIEKSYCCYYSTAIDFARVGMMVADSGRYKGQQVVPKDFIVEMLRPNGCVDAAGNRIDYYGYHWWMMKGDGPDVYYARGILGQYIIVIPERKLVIVRLGWKRGEKDTNNHYKDMMAYVNGVLSIF